MDSFTKAPEGFQRAHPKMQRTELLKTNFEIGQSVAEYQSSHMKQFQDPMSLKSNNSINFQNRNQRIHIITGEILNNNYKSSGYEAYTAAN